MRESSGRMFGRAGGGLAFGGMVVTILIQATNMVVSKTGMSHGLDKYIYVVYCNAISTVILFPCSFIFHRSSERPPLTFHIFLGFFMMAILGVSAQIFGNAGIEYGSPTLASALVNLIPAFTFILALIVRMEKLELGSRSCQAKVVGTIVSISGAFVVTFYKGPAIMDSATKTKTLSLSLHSSHYQAQSNWVLGGFFIAGEALTSAAWYILQAIILKKYTAVLVLQFYQNLFAAILAAIYSVIVVKELSSWKLRLDIGLVAVLYSSVFAFVIRLSLLTWCVGKTGPVYVSSFKPLLIIFTVLMSFAFLGDALHLGSVIGAVIIVIGFYSVMWGKAKERNELDSMALAAPLFPRTYVNSK